jgi:hypothetical protein
MLDLGRYLLGVAEILLLVGFAWVGAVAIRRKLVAGFDGITAHLATSVVALALLLWTAELLGSFGTFEAAPYLAVVIGVGLGIRLVVGGGWGRPTLFRGF